MRFENVDRGVKRYFIWAGILVVFAMVTSLVTGRLYANLGFHLEPQTSNPVSIEVQIDKREALIAERFRITIAATAPQGVTVNFPEPPKQIGDFEVMGHKDTLDIPSGSQRKWIRRLELESLFSGELEFPPVEVSYIDRRGSEPTTGLQSSPVQQITINSTIEGQPDPNQFRDIKTVVFLPQPPDRSTNWLVWTVGATGLLMIAVLAFVMTRRKSEPSPKNWAINALRELGESQSIEEVNAEQFYVRLVDILRIFVFRHYGISAPRLTTREFLEAMQSDDRLSPEFRTEFHELLKMADMVKFAAVSVDGGQLNAIVDQATRLVRNAADTDGTGNRDTEFNPDAGIESRSESSPERNSNVFN